MKKDIRKISIVSALMLIGCAASAAITSTYTDMGNLSSSVLSLNASSVSVEAGDVVVMIQSGNKKDSVVEVTFSSTASGSFTVLDASTVLSSDPNPDSDLAYLPITLSGTYDFTATASAGSTGNCGLYVLRADSGNIVFLDNDAVEWAGYSTVSESFSVTNSLSWTGDSGYGDIIAIGVGTSLKGNISANTLAGLLDEDNSSKRLAGDIAVSAGTTAYDVVWDITVAQATESGSAVAAAFAEAVAEPLLVSLENLVTDASGDGLSIVGETNTVQVVIANTGGAVATNVETAVTISSNPSYFTIITNSAASEVPAESQVTNVYTIIPTGSAVPDIYTFDVTISAAGGYGDTSTFDIEVAPVEAVLKNLANLVIDASGDRKTNPGEATTVSVIVRNGGQSTASNVAVGVSAVTNGAWFSIATNTAVADLAGGITQTNEFIIVPSLDTVPGDYSFDVSITADGGLSTNSSFVITVPAPVVIPSAPLEWFDMDDVAGTDLNDLSNSGSLNSEWNFNTAGHETDGDGLFVITGDASEGVFTRKLPEKGTANAETNGLLNVYASPLTNGAYSLTVNFDSWSFDAGSAGDLWKIKAQDLSGADIAGIEIGLDAGQGRIRAWTQGATNQYYRTYYFPAASMAGAAVEVVFDFDADTVSYVINGDKQFAANDFNGSELAGFVYTTAGDGTDDWATPETYIKIGSMGLDAVVESEPVTIVSQAGTTLANNLTEPVTVATFTAKAGDVLVLGAAGSNTNHIQPNAVSWTSLDGGMVGASVATSRSSAGLWYTTVSNGGTFAVKFQPTNNYVTAGAYQVRPKDTAAMAIDIQGRWLAANASSTNATLSYDIVADSDVAIVEVLACASSATSLVATVDYVNDPPKRLVASGEFEAVSSLTSEWTIDQSDTNNYSSVSLVGIAVYYSTNLLVTPDTPSSLYNEWLGAETVNTNLLEDVNGDGVNNLVDYAVGGAANLPVSAVDGGYMTYVHVQWDAANATDRGLSYTVEANTSLTNADGWSTSGVEFVGSVADTPEAGYLTVTNRIPTTGSQEFLRLKIEFKP